MIREPQQSPVGEAMQWASRIMAVGLLMFMPAVAGTWLDARFGTGWIGLVGLVIGVGAGIAWLVQIGRRGGT